jgi:L-iditol 2-dehydrogenase
MNAAVFYGPNNLQIKDIDKKKKQAEEGSSILLKVLSCSVCSYDVRTFRSGSFKVTPPRILGHEICAETIEGYKGKNFSIGSGTRVCVYPVVPCLGCWYCHNKKYNMCINLKEIGSTIDGGFAEYILVPKNNFEIGGIVPVPDSIANEEASLIEPLACCINGINQVKNLEFDSAIILGDGPIGLLQLILLRKLFSNKIKITIIGKIRHRLEKAKEIGADLAILLDEGNIEGDIQTIRNVNGEFSPNLVMVCTNNPNAVKLAFKTVNRNGKIMIFSGIKKASNPNDNVIDIDPNFIHYNQVSVFGSFSSNPINMAEAIDLARSKRIDLNHLITHRFPLEKINEAIYVSESFSGLKSIINKF